MKIHTIFHVPFEGLGIIQDWIDEHGHQHTASHLYRDDILPCTSEFDMLISMGGPQSVNEVDRYPYLQDEIELIHRAIEKDKYLVGVCLGAQLIAHVLGAQVVKSPEKEVGVFPIKLSDAGLDDRVFQNFPDTFNAVHWHGEMFTMPNGCQSLMSSEGCPNQAFAYGNKVYGLQFHLEQKPDNIEAMIKNCPEDLAPGKFIQTADEMRAADFAKLNEQAYLFLNGLVEA